MTRILIADNHEVVRLGLRDTIEEHAGWDVVAEATNGRQAIDRCLATKPDIAILDYTLPLINGLEVTRELRRRLPSVEVLIFTLHNDDFLMHQLLSAGALGYVLKSDPLQDVVSAIRCLAVHRPFFGEKVAEALLQALLSSTPEPDQPLSSRERNVVQLVAEGHSNKRIARVLNISSKTVETHRAAILRKLELTSSAGLVRYAIRTHLIEA